MECVKLSAFSLLVGLFYVLASFIKCGAQVPPQSTADLIKNTTDAVVLIVVSAENGNDTILGSGFIVSSDGKTITNNHVITGAHAAIAKLANGAYFPVESVIATDPERDLAVIKLPGQNLPFLVLADSDKVAIGEHVVAIGSPLGLQNTVSDGIVSAIREEKPGITWIQTTAPVSQGNSGGPLLLNTGSVAGVITWTVKNGQNLNFAAPANEVKALLLSPVHGANLPADLHTRSTSDNRSVQLSDVHKIAVSSFGPTEAAALVREKLITRLAASGKVTIVEDRDRADAVLSGVVGTDFYGRASTAAVRLVTGDGRNLWGVEATRARMTRSTSSSIAEHIAKDLLKIIEQEQARKASASVKAAK